MTWQEKPVKYTVQISTQNTAQSKEFNFRKIERPKPEVKIIQNYSCLGGQFKNFTMVRISTI